MDLSENHSVVFRYVHHLQLYRGMVKTIPYIGAAKIDMLYITPLPDASSFLLFALSGPQGGQLLRAQCGGYRFCPAPLGFVIVRDPPRGGALER